MKKVCEILIATFLKMSKKNKDGMKAKQDLIPLDIREELRGESEKLNTTKAKNYQSSLPHFNHD
jgi:hypothetical protein